MGLVRACAGAATGTALAAILRTMSVVERLRLAEPLPNSSTRAFWALALFVAVQVADGVLTALGIARFGQGVEANPIIVHSMLAFGSGAALVMAKTVAIAGGTLLYVHSYHLVTMQDEVSSLRRASREEYEAARASN